MSDQQPRALPLPWQKAQTVAVILASLAVPVVLGLIGNEYTKNQKSQELGARYVELAIGILRTEPTKGSKALRNWAVAVVDHFSPVSLPPGAKSELELQQLLVEIQAESQKQREEMERLSNELKRLHDEAMKPIRKLR